MKYRVFLLTRLITFKQKHPVYDCLLYMCQWHVIHGVRKLGMRSEDHHQLVLITISGSIIVRRPDVPWSRLGCVQERMVVE